VLPGRGGLAAPQDAENAAKIYAADGVTAHGDAAGRSLDDLRFEPPSGCAPLAPSSTNLSTFVARALRLDGV